MGVMLLCVYLYLPFGCLLWFEFRNVQIVVIGIEKVPPFIITYLMSD